MPDSKHPTITREISNDLPDGDYTLSDGCAWFTVGGRSVRIRSTKTTVQVEIYPLGKEMEPVLAFCSAPQGRMSRSADVSKRTVNTDSL